MCQKEVPLRGNTGKAHSRIREKNEAQGLPGEPRWGHDVGASVTFLNTLSAPSAPHARTRGGHAAPPHAGGQRGRSAGRRPELPTGPPWGGQGQQKRVPPLSPSLSPRGGMTEKRSQKHTAGPAPPRAPTLDHPFGAANVRRLDLLFL